MRDFLNAVLAFIGASSLTNDEYNAINFANINVNVYDLNLYTQLSNVLISREAVSTMTDKLRFLFLSKGVDVPVADKASSNIFIGCGL